MSIRKMQKISKPKHKESDIEKIKAEDLKNATFKALEDAGWLMWNTESIYENENYVEIAIPIERRFQNEKGEQFCMMILATPMNNIEKFGLRYIDTGADINDLKTQIKKLESEHKLTED